MIYLIRHAQSIHNVKSSRVAGVALQSPLTDVGIKQSRDIGIEFHRREIEAIYHSPALRCKDMAKIMARQFVNEPDLISDERLLEMDQGEAAGKLKLSIVLNPLTFIRILTKRKDFAFKGGESFNVVAQRMEDALNEIKNTEKKDTLVITHGMAIRALLSKRSGSSVWRIILGRVGNAEIIELKE